MESGTVTLAKITKPRLQKVLPRHRLFGLLNQSGSYPAIWISGPGGSGKTTLVSSYIDQCRLPCLWYQMDESDSDIATFFYYMGLAAKNKAGPTTRDLPILPPAQAKALAGFTKKYFEALFNQIEKPGALVLDNHQDVLPSQLFHEVLRNALTVIPDQVRVFILSRISPPAALARARARGILYEIGWPQLRLHPEETRELVRLLDHNAFSDASISRLHRQTDGWAAGLVLLLKRSAPEQMADGSLDGLAEHEIFDYFVSEVFAEAEPEVQQFLQKTAVFPFMSSEMAAKLTGNSQAEALLSRMSQNHWFTEMQHGRPARYRYHPMFREFLLKSLARSLSAARMRSLKEKAARLLKADGQAEAALSLFFETGRVDEAFYLILSQARRFVLQGRIRTLEEWLRRLPDEIIAGNPRALYWLGACRLYIDPVQGKNYFEKALSIFEDQGDITAALFCVCGVIDSITYGFGSFSALDPWIQKIEAAAGQPDTIASREIKGRVTFSMLHALALRQPDHCGYSTWEQRGSDILQSDYPAEIKIRILLPILIHRIFAGRLTEADYLLKTYAQFRHDPDIPPLYRLSLKNLEAFHCWLSGDLAAGRQAVRDGLNMAYETGIPVVTAFLSGHGAAAALSSGDSAAADEMLKKMQQSMPQEAGWIQAYFHVLVLWQALLHGDAPEALLNGRLALQYAESAGMPASIAISRIGLGLALHEKGRLAEAAEEIQEAYAVCRQTGSRQIEYACCLAEAECALDLGDQAAALRAAEKAMAIGKDYGYRNVWFWRPAAMARICCKALEAGIAVAYGQALVRKRSLVPEKPPLEIENWPWPVRIYTFGRFAVMQDDKPLQLFERAREKPLALLKAIISFGGRGVSINRLADILWPDADGDAAHGAFKTNLHRLRHMLGHPGAIRVAAGSLTLQENYCWVDVWVFERRLTAAEACWHAGEPDKKDGGRAAELTQAALALYKGRFLESDEDMAIPYREYLHARFLKAVNQLGRHWQQCGRWEKAIDVWEAGIRRDALAESFYQGLMLCNARLGEKSRALAVYERCRKILSAALDIGPSEETEALKRSIFSDTKRTKSFY